MHNSALNLGGSGVDLLPDSATICSCNNVSKADICKCNCRWFNLFRCLKNVLKPATACGGCAPLVTQVLKSELQRQGVTVNNHICEHFAYSRQELYHLVRVNEIQNF